jgi:hypothetical protein
MALRGVRPRAEDLADVAEDPALLPMFVDQYLEDPRFAETVKDIYAEALLLRAQLNQSMLAYRGPLFELDDSTYMASVPEEPLKLIEWVVSDPDRSFSEIVTTDTVLVDEVGAAAWHVSGYVKKTGGWQAVQWSDDRPQGGGVLASSALWHRHPSNGNNYHRARANLVSRVFLCDDYLSRDVPPFNDVDFSDADAVTNALQQNPGCQGCHQTLDPLAGYFWGVASRGRAGIVQAYDPMDGVTCLKPEVCYPTTEYNPDLEQNWAKTTKREPGYFGVPEAEGGVDRLGLRVAADPRFAQCTARRFYSYMAQVHLDAVAFPLVERFTDALDQDGKLDVRALAREIVLSDEFRAAYSVDPDEAETLVGYKLARPEQLARMFKELTGFDWYGIRTPATSTASSPCSPATPSATAPWPAASTATRSPRPPTPSTPPAPSCCRPSRPRPPTSSSPATSTSPPTPCCSPSSRTATPPSPPSARRSPCSTPASSASSSSPTAPRSTPPSPCGPPSPATTATSGSSCSPPCSRTTA